MAEKLFSFIVGIEIILVFLLILRPMQGILGSAIMLLTYSMIIIGLNFYDPGELYGCFGDVSAGEISLGKILQQIGLSLLLFLLGG